MKLSATVKAKFSRSGVRGVAAGALRHVADSIDRPQNNGDGKPANEFLTWVRFAVPGMLNEGNIVAMEYAIANVPPDSHMLEIGSFCGLSTTVLTYLLDKRGNPGALYTSDKWEFENRRPGESLGDSPSVTHDAYRVYVRDTFLRTMQTFAAHRLPHTIECFSDEFFSRWFNNDEATDVFGRKVTLGGKFGFCYIDGNHTYEFAKRDFENSDRALLPGGFILFDDSADGSEWEVNRLTREIAAGSAYELISKSPNYLFRKK